MSRLTKQPFVHLAIIGLVAACGNTSEPDSKRQRTEYVQPSWQKFRSIPFEQRRMEAPPGYEPTDGRFVFADLKYESEQSLSKRLLGALATRIVFIDRHQDRWQYYGSDNDPIRRVTLFSQPEPWGSAFGLCRTEIYEVSFSDDGSISSVDVSPRYGVEGPIFKKENFDWDEFRGKMCDEVPPDHTRSYFPVSDSVLEAKDLAILLSLAIDAAGRDGALPYELSCTTYDGRKCQSDIREFLSGVRLHEIDAVSMLNCTGDARDCYTVTVGEHQLGPYPKHITIKGTTYMNDWQVDSVSVVEALTES